MTSPLAVVVQRVEGKEVGVPLNRLWLCSCLKTLIFSLAQKAEEMNLLALFAVNSRHKGTKLCRVLQAKWIWREKMEFNKKIFESKVHRAFIYLTPVADTVKAPCVAYITPSGEWVQLVKSYIFLCQGWNERSIFNKSHLCSITICNKTEQNALSFPPLTSSLAQFTSSI